MTQTPDELRARIRDVQDFPKPGIVFKDLTPLLADYQTLTATIALLAEPWRDSDVSVVAGIEARGFLLAPMVAEALGVGMVPLRKPGKLPWKTKSETYALEYGTDTLEIHEDAVGSGDRVLLIDDVLATGGTASAGVRLLQACGAVVLGCAFVIELGFLNGRPTLGVPATSVLLY
jgi:adenine phosphoribosyltransferase